MAMTMKQNSIQQTEAIEADLLLLVLRERYGYDFSGYGRASLMRRLQQLAEDFSVPHLVDLLPTLLHDEETAREVINHLSVPVSDFFRDPPVWKYLREKVIPELESFPRINIWQVGCGCGQESYSLAILLHECGLALQDADDHHRHQQRAAGHGAARQLADRAVRAVARQLPRGRRQRLLRGLFRHRKRR
jgi:chemotaxis protein methyltransferase CheR